MSSLESRHAQGGTVEARSARGFDAGCTFLIIITSSRLLQALALAQ